MSNVHPRHLRSAGAALAVIVAALLGACQKDNPGFCGDSCPVDADVTDAREGCVANPSLCTLDEDCLDNVCVDCTGPNDHQSADCTHESAPICTNRACRACTADVECESGFCDHGACAPPTTVLFVRPDGDPDGALACTDVTHPCKTINQALAKVPAVGGAPDTNRRFIQLLTIATYADNGPVIVDGVAVVIRGAPQSGTDRSVIDRTTNGLTMDVKGGAVVRLERLAVSNGTGTGADGISCHESAKLVADGIEISNNTGIGIVGNTCELTLANSLVNRNAGGGASVTGGVQVAIVNNVILDNGSSVAGGSDFGALLISAQVLPTSVVQSNTAVSNHAATGQPDGIDCRPAGITARNNIVTGDATKPRVAGACAFDHTLYGPDDPGAHVGTANGNLLIPNEADLQFVNPAMRDYHIKAASFAKGKGTVTGLAPEAAVDMDGQVRPQGAPDVGADEIPD